MTGTNSLALSTLYLVMGCSGTYEDRSEWVVACLADQLGAETLRDQAQREAQAEIRRRRLDGDVDDCNFLCATPFDLSMRVVDGHVAYRVAPTLMCSGVVRGRGLLDGSEQLAEAAGRLGLPRALASDVRRGEARGAFAEKLQAALTPLAH